MSFFEILEKNGWYFFTTLLSGWPATLTVATGALVFCLASAVSFFTSVFVVGRSRTTSGTLWSS